MSVILGIDPGSRITGYGIIKSDGLKHSYIACGCIRTEGEKLAERLQQIFEGLCELIKIHRPQDAAIEEVFMHRNANSAIKLGQARGAAIVATKHHAMTISEYSARHVKLAITGYGAAQKQQVQHMVCQLLNLKNKPSVDAADALAIALCHAFNQRVFAKKGRIT